MRFSALRLRAVRVVRKYFHRQLDAHAMTNLDDVAPYIRRHLKEFYFTLFCAAASSALGSYSSSTGIIGSYVSALGAFMSIISFYVTAPWKENKRFCLFISGAFFGGASVAPWFILLPYVDSGFVVSAFSATSVGFGCFWAASKWTIHFDLVYYRALILSIVLILAWLFFTSAIFGGESAFWKYQLFFLVLWIMVYVVVYSQEMVVKVRKGDGDYVKHAVRFFTDFPPVVITVIRLLKANWRRDS